MRHTSILSLTSIFMDYVFLRLYWLCIYGRQGKELTWFMKVLIVSIMGLTRSSWLQPLGLVWFLTPPLLPHLLSLSFLITIHVPGFSLLRCTSLLTLFLTSNSWSIVFLKVGCLVVMFTFTCVIVVVVTFWVIGHGCIHLCCGFPAF